MSILLYKIGKRPSREKSCVECWMPRKLIFYFGTLKEHWQKSTFQSYWHKPWGTKAARIFWLRFAESLYSFCKNWFFVGFLVVDGFLIVISESFHGFWYCFLLVFSLLSDNYILKTMKKPMKRLWKNYPKTINFQKTTKNPIFSKRVQTFC